MSVRMGKPRQLPNEEQKPIEEKVGELLDEKQRQAEERELMAREDEQAEQEKPPQDAPPLPKTSPVPIRGDVVIYRTQDKARRYNGTADHPAIVTRIWTHSDGTIACVNLKVLPDHGEAYDVGSSARIHASDFAGEGWFTRGEQG